MAAPILTGAPSQQTFDGLLRALAEPGTIRSLPYPLADPTVPAVALLPLALGDIDLGISVDDDPSHPLAATIRAATGMTITAQVDAWIVVHTGATGPLGPVALGTALAPEDGARVAIAVDDLRADGPDAVELSGPGIPGTRRLAVAGFPVDELLRLGQAGATFPAGFDTWLFTPDGRTTAIPRSTRVVRGDQ